MRAPFEVDLATFEARILPAPPSTTPISPLDLTRAEQKISRIAAQFHCGSQEETLAFELVRDRSSYVCTRWLISFIGKRIQRP